MKTRSERLATVRNLANQQEQQAAQTLASSQRQLAEQLNQLQELELFRAEYARQFNAAGQQGVSAGKLNDQWQFLAQLDRAIASQRETIHRTRQLAASQQQTWTDKRVRATVMDGLVEQVRDSEQRDSRRRAQRELDDRIQLRRDSK